MAGSMSWFKSLVGGGANGSLADRDGPPTASSQPDRSGGPVINAVCLVTSTPHLLHRAGQHDVRVLQDTVRACTLSYSTGSCGTFSRSLLNLNRSFLTSSSSTRQIK